MTDFDEEQNVSRRFVLRLVFVLVGVMGGLLLLAMRGYYLQVLRHSELYERGESNRTAIVPIVPYRGNIIDCNDVMMASNYSAYTLDITPARVRNLEKTIDELSTIISIEPIDRRRFARLRGENNRFSSLSIRSRLSDEEVARFTAQAFRFPGVQLSARLFRAYPLNNTASHVVGYIGRINQRDLERIEARGEEANYRGSTYIGKTGIEAYYESDLHGTTGVEQLERSSAGQPLRVMDSLPAHSGDSVELSLDAKLQQLIERLYGDRRGALVAIDPSNGEVIAMVSMPTFNPNLFIDGIDQENWQALNESIDRPLFNRALRGLYPPGSTYKPFMALAALETGSRNPKTVIVDRGVWTLGGHRYRGAPVGAVDMRLSLVYSSNIYYYSLAYEMGVDKIHNFMQKLGFGQLTGIDLSGEARGILPSREWKRKAFSDPRQRNWVPGDTPSLGIGQGYNSFTMLQLAHALATVANGGISHVPHLARAVLDPERNVMHPIAQPPGVDLGFKPENLQIVFSGMEGVVKEGTARRVFVNAPYRSAGKTGTAQAFTLPPGVRYDAAKLAESKRDHSLYIAFAPVEKPRIALALIVENAGFGAQHAAPIARRVLDYWISGIYPSEEDILAVQQSKALVPIGVPRRVVDIPMPEAKLPANALAEEPQLNLSRTWREGLPVDGNNLRPVNQTLPVPDGQGEAAAVAAADRQTKA